MDAWMHTDEDGHHLEIDASSANDPGKVVIAVDDGDEAVEVAMDPEVACRAATELVRAAGRANGEGEPVSVYMPTDMWEELINLAEIGASHNVPEGRIVESLKVVKAVVRGAPSAEL